MMLQPEVSKGKEKKPHFFFFSYFFLVIFDKLEENRGRGKG